MTTKIEKAATEWIAIKTEMTRLEQRKNELKEILEPYLEEIEEHTAIIAGFQFTLIEVEKENFKLSAAKEKIDGRVLKPYITTSKFTQIRTTWKGGEQEMAA